MQIELPTDELSLYKSASQQVRVVTEAWGAANLYCANCHSPEIERMPHNMPAIDFVCPVCQYSYQLKSQSNPFAAKIVDAAYNKMCQAIREDRTPNLLAMHYDRTNWRVKNLILIPKFAFSEAAIEKRNPTIVLGRTKPWVGCNILLGRIPVEARLLLIENGKPVAPASVRRAYVRVKPLALIEPRHRGWTLDVLAAVRSLGKQSFTLTEAYSLERKLARLHPANQHVRDKIRQQLQVLRDVGLLDFIGRGEYRMRS